MSSKPKTTATKENSKVAGASSSKAQDKREQDAPATLVPKLRFPEFRGAEGWRKAALGDLMEITSSKRVHESDWAATGVPFYRAREIVALNNGEPITPLFISEDLYRENAKKSGEIVPGDLLVSGVGSIGIPYLVKPNDRFYFKDGNIIWLKNRGTKLAGQFLLTLYGTQFVQSQIKTMAGVGTVGTYTIDNANKTVVVFPVDDIEQQKIAECLSSVDELIGAQARKLDALKTHKKGLMQQLFPREGETQPRLRFPEFRKAGEWGAKTLVDACRMQAGKFVAAADIKVQNTGDLFPCYGGNGLRGFTATRTHDGIYPLIGRQGALCGNIRLATGRFHATEHAVVATPNRGVDAVWLYYLLDLLNLNRFATGQAQPGLSVDVLEKVPVTIPNDEHEQHRIATCLSSLDALITAETQKLEALKTHKRGLMQQLFPSPEATGATQVSPLRPAEVVA